MLTVLTYLWQDPEFKQEHGFSYHPDDVRLLKRMVDRHMTEPHDFAVVTDTPQAFVDDKGIRPVPFPERRAHVDGRIYEKLYTFSDDMKRVGSRILQMDLDCVVVGDMDPLVQRDEDIVLWRNPRRTGAWTGRLHPTIAFYNASLLLITAGAYAHVWDGFDPELTEPQWSGDQDWYSHVLGPDMPHWDNTDGAWRYWRHVKNPEVGFKGALPDNARVVFFPGGDKPWEPEIMREAPWIAEHRY